MPVYNGEQFLEETLGTLLDQTYSDFELVISDNASTDGTEEICRAFVGRDARIDYYRQERNRGAAFNYNHVFTRARGEFFKWAAADDLCAPNHLHGCVEVLDRHPDAVLAYPKTMIIDANGRKVKSYDDRLRLTEEDPVSRFRSCFRLLRECNAVFGLMRSRVLGRTARIGAYMGSDVVLLAELSLHGKFIELPETLFFRRDHDSASSSDKSIAAQQEFFDPDTKGRVFLRMWRHQVEYLGAVRRAPLTFGQKARLRAMILRSAITRRKSLTRELRVAASQRLRRRSRSR